MKDLAVPSRSSGLIPLFVMAHFAHHLLTAILVPLLPMIRTDLGLDYTQSGFVVSAFNMSYGVGQLPGGWLSGKFGNRLMIAISIGGVALAGLLIGFSRGYPMLIALLILMGIMGGGYHPASSMVLSASAGAAKSGRVLGIHLIGGSACYFLAPLIAAPSPLRGRGAARTSAWLFPVSCWVSFSTCCWGATALHLETEIRTPALARKQLQPAKPAYAGL